MHINLLNRFLLKWVLYTSLGWLLAEGAGIFIASATFPNADLTALPTSPLYFGVFGFIFGVSQWICVRDHIPNSFQWILWTATGCFIAALILKMLNQFELINSFLRGFPILVYFFGGLMIGFAQYQVMKRSSSKAHWWTIIMVVSWVIAQSFIGIDNTLIDFLGILSFAIITGVSFIWLVQYPSSEMQSA